MSLEELIERLNRLHELMDGSIDLVTESARKAQEEVYAAITEAINHFEIADGRYVVTQNYGKRIAILEKKIKSILGDIYAPSITEYLSTFSTVEETNIALQKSYNDLEIETKLLTPAKAAIYSQAEYNLVDALAPAYVQPMKFLLMSQVTQGISLKDSQKILKRWNDGEATVNNGRQTVNLQRYATQVSRDSLYGYHGAINEVIAKEYDLEDFIYTGDIIEDTRPICRHLVNLKRTVELSEMPELIKKFPQGLYPNTDKDNFIQRRGGYSCRHSAFAVKS